MGSRYTNEEISQIQALTQEGRTIKDIAEILGRPEAARARTSWCAYDNSSRVYLRD